MGIRDLFRKKEDLNCPECAKHQKHVRLVEVDGKTMECPECHYIHTIKR